MNDSSSADSERLAVAMVEAFPRYVWERVGELGVVGGSTVDAAIASGVEELRQTLGDLLAQPGTEQTRSPLELVRRATHPVTAALVALGVQRPTRDGFLAETYPEDHYDLYPASSQSLGDEVWRLHLEWGKAKAASVAGMVPARETAPVLPAVAVFGIPPAEREPIASAVEAHGFRLVVWRNPAALEEATSVRPVLVVVDLRHPNAHDAIRLLGEERLRVVVTGPDVNDLVAPGLMALGAEDVVAADGFFARLDSLLPRLA